MNFFFFSLGLLSFIGDGDVVGKVMNCWNNGDSRRISHCLRLKLPSKPRNVAEYWYSRKLLLFFTSISCSLCSCLIFISFFDFSTHHFFLAFFPYIPSLPVRGCTWINVFYTRPKTRVAGLTKHGPRRHA